MEAEGQGQRASGQTSLTCGGFHTTGRSRRGAPLGALDFYRAPPPLEAWGASPVSSPISTLNPPRLSPRRSALALGPSRRAALRALVPRRAPSRRAARPRAAPRALCAPSRRTACRALAPTPQAGANDGWRRRGRGWGTATRDGTAAAAATPRRDAYRPRPRTRPTCEHAAQGSRRQHTQQPQLAACPCRARVQGEGRHPWMGAGVGPGSNSPARAPRSSRRRPPARSPP